MQNTTLPLPMERIPQSPPIVASVPDVARPQWSVIIPTYNCRLFLPDALRSVLAQDPGPDEMEIIVVDDASTDTDVAELVKQVAGNRVVYFQQKQNIGSLLNIATGLNMSKGRYIHILHGDDKVRSGFYDAVARVFRNHPECGMVFTQNSYIAESGVEVGIKTPMCHQEGIIDNWYERIVVCNLLEAPAAVVKRSVYEHLGAFYGAHYGEDWEMWARIAAHYPVGYTPQVLAQYRKSDNNISANAHRKLLSVSDIYTIMNNIHNALPPGKRKQVANDSRRSFSNYFATLAIRLSNYRPRVGFAMSRKAFKMHRNLYTLFSLLKTGNAFFLNVLHKIKITGAPKKLDTDLL